MDKRRAAVHSILNSCAKNSARIPTFSVSSGEAWAPINIALCKYWGKCSNELNIPWNSSLSLSLDKGTKTIISPATQDMFFLNDVELPASSQHTERLFRYLEYFRTREVPCFRVESWNEIPTKAGLASSASAFAALVLAMNQLFQWNLAPRELSILARLGSGSACRSIERGFVLWQRGVREDGLDSYAQKVDGSWLDLRVALILTSKEEKQVGSTEGMERTAATSPLYAVWPETTERQVIELEQAIKQKNFELFGEIIESNAMMMHATMLGARPPLLYWNCETVKVLHTIWKARKEGVKIYPTLDAGPNIKLFYTAAQENEVKKIFPNLLTLHPLFE
jgi:diphosphomevalonate decarboxylase